MLQSGIGWLIFKKNVVDKVHDANEIEVVSESTFEAEEKGKLFSTF